MQITRVLRKGVCISSHKFIDQTFVGTIAIWVPFTMIPRETFTTLVTMEGVYERVNGQRIQHQTLFRHRKPGEALTVRNDCPSMHYIHAQQPCHPLEEDVCDLLCNLLLPRENRL